MTSRYMKRLAPLISLALICVIWEDLIILLKVPIYVLPAPSDIALSLFKESSPGGDSVALFLARATVQTGFAALLGFLLAAVIGVLLGTLLASVGFLRRGVYPLANLLQMVPIIAIAPLLNIWFGYGVVGVAASAMIVSIFPIIANTVDGLRSVNPQLIELFSVYDATSWQRWTKLEIPAALPQIFTGLRVAAGLAVIGAVVGELVSGVLTDPPIGAVIAANLKTGKLDLVFAAIGCSALVGFILFGAVAWISEQFMGSWSSDRQLERLAEQRSTSSPVERVSVSVIFVGVALLSVWAYLTPRGASQESRGAAVAVQRDAAGRVPLKLQLNWVPEPEFGGIYEADRLGLDHSEGLDFRIISGGPGTPTAQLLAQRKIELGVVDGSEIVTMRAQGAKLVPLFASFQTNPRAIITRRADAPADLKSLWASDRQLSVEAGAPFLRWLKRVYGEGGLTSVSSQGGLTQFKLDPKRAQSVYVFSEPVTLKLDGIETKVFPIAESGLNPYSVIIAAHEDWIQENPELAEAVYRALERGWTSYLRDSRPTNEMISKMNPAMSFEAMQLAVQFARPYIEGDVTRSGGRLGEMKVERWETLESQFGVLGLIPMGTAQAQGYQWSPQALNERGDKRQ